MSVNKRIKYVVEMYRLCVKKIDFLLWLCTPALLDCTVTNYLILMYQLDSDSAHKCDIFLMTLVVRYGRQLVRCA